jgi:hypothetical protein
MSEMLAAHLLARSAAHPAAPMILAGRQPDLRFSLTAADAPVHTDWVPAKGVLAGALVHSDDLSRMNNPKPLRLIVEDRTLATGTSLGRPSQQPEFTETS